MKKHEEIPLYFVTSMNNKTAKQLKRCIRSTCGVQAMPPCFHPGKQHLHSRCASKEKRHENNVPSNKSQVRNRTASTALRYLTLCKAIRCYFEEREGKSRKEGRVF